MYIWTRESQLLSINKETTSQTIRNGVFSFMNKWNDYLWPMAIIRSENHYTIQIAIKMFQGQFNTDWPMMLTGATVSVIPILILYVAFQKGFEQGLSGASAGMKE